jgi:predicted  nucleic acid-binding Zn-ribbon protein
MGKFVIGCVVLFVLALGFVVLTQAHNIAALFEAFRSEPLSEKLAWLLIVLIPLALVPSALWLSDSLLRQRRSADALELRLGGVRAGVKELAKSQVDAEAAVHQLARTDPEDAISTMQQRLTEAERLAQVQMSRNEIGDLQGRVDDVRAQQDKLRERLLPALEKRRAIEQLFTDLDTRESDIDRALAEIASGDDALALEVRLKNLVDFVRSSHERCDEIEQASKTLAALKEDYSALRARLGPLAAVEDGIPRRVKELSEARDRLGAEIEALQLTPQGNLVTRVQGFVDDKRKLDDSVANLDAQFSKLASLRKDLEKLFENFDGALDLLGISDEAAADPDARVEEVSEFIKVTQAHVDEIERKVVDFTQLKTRLGDIQARLAPLEAREGGVGDLIAQVADIRDRLVGKIKHLEEDKDGDLATRVKAFTEAKQDLEQRVAAVNEHFAKLAIIRNDIAGLFNKLSSAANAASN